MKQPRVFALITAKGGNESLENKNLIKIRGKESVLYSLEAAKESKWISEVFITSEDARIRRVCSENGALAIERPAHLAQPATNHGDVIQHAYQEILNVKGKFDVLVVLLGNTVMTSAEDIDKTVGSLLADKEATSCMTVWVAQDDHPLRAMVLNENGYLESYRAVSNVDTNRQSYPEVLYYDQGPWAVLTSTLETATRSSLSPGPWWWMGNKSLAIKRAWVTGRDTHTELDLLIAEWWVDNLPKSP